MSDNAMSSALRLLAVANDPAAAKKRLAELKKATADAEPAKAELEKAKIANERANAEANTDLDRRRARIAEDEVDLRLRIEAFKEPEGRAAVMPSDDRFPVDGNLSRALTHTQVW
jgi:hypothetical protein